MSSWLGAREPRVARMGMKGARQERGKQWKGGWKKDAGVRAQDMAQGRGGRGQGGRLEGCDGMHKRPPLARASDLRLHAPRVCTHPMLAWPPCIRATQIYDLLSSTKDQDDKLDVKQVGTQCARYGPHVPAGPVGCNGAACTRARAGAGRTLAACAFTGGCTHCATLAHPSSKWPSHPASGKAPNPKL